ncbi:MAG: rod shape-determining protein MreC [Solirubrobacterales bacterium]
MYRKQVRRRRAVLLLLVAVSLTLLSLQFRESSGGPLHGFQRGVATVFSPLQGAADRAFKPGRDLVNWFDETFNARGDNKKLSEEVADLRDQLAISQAHQQQGEELKKLLDLSSAGLIPAGRTPVTARVIGRSPSVWYSTVTIDKGYGDDVHVDDPVVTGAGLAGPVRQVTRNSAQVTLITDHTSSVAARVEPVNATGVVEPQIGNPDDLLLDYVEKGTDIQETQQVVTAGFSGGGVASLYPPGIPIGEVSQSSLEEERAYQRVHIDPYADLRNMEFVQALVESGGKG